jgi:hypothetical protein
MSEETPDTQPPTGEIVTSSSGTPDSSLKIQVGGDHYRQYKHQPIVIARDNELDAMQFSVIKYVMRHKNKDGLKDIRKAIHFLQMIAEYDYGVFVPIEYAGIDKAAELPKAPVAESGT